MRIKIYILTFNDEVHLNTGLSSMFASNDIWPGIDAEIYIINNHTNFTLWPGFQNKVRVLHNVLQPDFGLGHPTRNWNQALMHGFKNLNNPDADLVICVQDDTVYSPGWLKQLIKAHKELGYEFIACGHGDNLCSYTPLAVKKIGLWDERFCSLHYGEHDYLLRAAMHLGNKASCNDNVHGDVYWYNPLPYKIVDKPVWAPDERKYALRHDRQWLDHLNHHLFYAKWGDWHENMKCILYVGKPMKPLIPGYILYPYFERGIDDLAEKGYNWDHGNDFDPKNAGHNCRCMACVRYESRIYT